MPDFPSADSQDQRADYLDTARCDRSHTRHRPDTVYHLAALLSAAQGLDAGRGTTVVAAVLAGQLSVGWSNDLIDLPRDRIAIAIAPHHRAAFGKIRRWKAHGEGE